MITSITRGRFLAGAAAAATAALGVPILVRGRSTAPPSVTSIRVKLFTGSVVTRVDLSGSVPLTASIDGQTRTFASMSFDAISGQVIGDGAVLAASNAPVVVSASAPIGVNVSSGSGSLGTRHYNGSLSMQRVNQSALLIN